MEFTQERNRKQAFGSNQLTDTDRKLLVRASLTLFLRRLNHGIPVLRSDLLQIAYYAPEDPGAA